MRSIYALITCVISTHEAHYFIHSLLLIIHLLPFFYLLSPFLLHALYSYTQSALRGSRMRRGRRAEGRLNMPPQRRMFFLIRERRRSLQPDGDLLHIKGDAMHCYLRGHALYSSSPHPSHASLFFERVVIMFFSEPFVIYMFSPLRFPSSSHDHAIYPYSPPLLGIWIRWPLFRRGGGN